MRTFISTNSQECYRYKMYENKQCPYAEYHQFLKGKTQAMSECDSDPFCFAIYDPGCMGTNFLICRNENRWQRHPRIKSLESCIYKKPSKHIRLRL